MSKSFYLYLIYPLFSFSPTHFYTNVKKCTSFSYHISFFRTLFRYFLETTPVFGLHHLLRFYLINIPLREQATSLGWERGIQCIIPPDVYVQSTQKQKLLYLVCTCVRFMLVSIDAHRIYIYISVECILNADVNTRQLL